LQNAHKLVKGVNHFGFSKKKKDSIFSFFLSLIQLKFITHEQRKIKRYKLSLVFSNQTKNGKKNPEKEKENPTQLPVNQMNALKTEHTNQRGKKKNNRKRERERESLPVSVK
jgi:hypothetical protein